MQRKGTYSPQLLVIHSDVYWHERLYSDTERLLQNETVLQKGQGQNNTVIKNRFFPCNLTAAQVQWKADIRI